MTRINRFVYRTNSKEKPLCVGSGQDFLNSVTKLMLGTTGVQCHTALLNNRRSRFDIIRLGDLQLFLFKIKLYDCCIGPSSSILLGTIYKYTFSCDEWKKKFLLFCRMAFEVHCKLSRDHYRKKV